MVRNVYGLPSETQDSSEAGLLTQAFVFPVGKRYASALEISDADRVLYYRAFTFDTIEEARIDLIARLRVTEGVTRDGVQRLLDAEDDYRGTFRLAEHRFIAPTFVVVATIVLEHYSRMPNLREVRPEYYGSGIAGAEKRRMRNDPETWVDRAYFYEMGSTPESDLQGAFRYYAHLPPDARIYDIAQDSDNLKARSLNPAGGVDLNLLERNVKDAGYFGFKNSASSMPYAVGVFYALPVSKEQEVASEESGVFDTHEPGSIGDFRPQNRYLGEMAMIERFVKEAGSTEEYLQSLGASPDVIQFIMTQPTDLAKRLVNETRKNPQITVQQMEEFVAKFTGQPKYEPTAHEYEIANRYQNIPGMVQWILLQLKKHRGQRRQVNRETTNFPSYEFAYTIPVTGEDFPSPLQGRLATDLLQILNGIQDWVRSTDAQLASYDFASAKSASDKWHEEQAAQGAGGGYEEKNIVHKFENGWTVQLVKSKNDLEVEGNQMGHCVGSYCREVTRGSSIIYSLRDPKNQPHATIEVKGDTESQEGEPYPYIRDTRYDTVIDHGPKGGEWNIVQIQGKQNQEPIPEYKAMIKEWLSTIEGKKSMGDDQKNLDDALYYAAQDMKANEEVLDKYSNANEGEVDDYGIPVEYQVSDPSDITTRVVGNYEHYINLNHRYYRYRGDLADSLADAAWKADEDYFSKPENDWQNYTRDFARRYPSLMQLPVGAPPKEQIEKFITDKSKYSAVQDMYSRNDDFYEKFQQHYLDSWYDDWVRHNPEPDQEDEEYETFAQFELAHDKWEKQREQDEQEAMDDALGEDPFGGFYSAFFERLNHIASNRETPFEAWRQKQLSYAEPAKPQPRKRTPR